MILFMSVESPNPERHLQVSVPEFDGGSFTIDFLPDFPDGFELPG